MTSGLRRRRLPLLAIGILGLLLGLAAGLGRLGVALPLPAVLIAAHGPLMVAGFLGTVIGLERAVGLGARWSFAVPLAAAAGTVLLVAGVGAVAAPLFAASGLGLVAIFAVVLRRQPTLHGAVMGLGAVALAGGHLLLAAGVAVARLQPLWAAGLILTIAGERLELNRLRRPSPLARRLFLAALVPLLVGPLVALHDLDLGSRLLAGGELAVAIWLGFNDLARRTVRQPGLPRFVAACLLSGYAWLAVGGLLGLRFGGVAAGPIYDAILHARYVGFVLGMIFGHAPIVFPAILGRPLHFSRRAYAPLALLGGSLLLRLAGDLGGSFAWRRYGAVGNSLAVLLFLAFTVAGLVASRPSDAA